MSEDGNVTETGNTPLHGRSCRFSRSCDDGEQQLEYGRDDPP